MPDRSFRGVDAQLRRKVKSRPENPQLVELADHVSMLRMAGRLFAGTYMFNLVASKLGNSTASMDYCTSATN
jgi:hypothetical protein